MAENGRGLSKEELEAIAQEVQRDARSAMSAFAHENPMPAPRRNGTSSTADRDAFWGPDASSPPRKDVLIPAGELNFQSLAQINSGVHPTNAPLLQGMLFCGAWLLVGRPKIGKSWLQLQLALAVAEHHEFLGFACAMPQAEVLMICAEDNAGRLQGRLQALGVGTAPQGCHVITQGEFMALAESYADLGPFPQFLELWLAAHPAVKLVLIDTEVAVRQIWGGAASEDGSARVTEADYKQTRAYDALALKMQICILLVNHAKKKNGEYSDIHELINRSNTALAGASGSIVLADPPDADPFDPTQKLRLLGVRGRDIRDDILLAVRQHEEMPYFSSEGPYAQVRQSEAQELTLLALEQIMPGMEEGQYVSSADLSEHMDKSRAAVKRCISRMLSKNLLVWKGYRVDVKRGKGGGLRLEKL
jgi:biotin operon repressor